MLAGEIAPRVGEGKYSLIQSRQMQLLDLSSGLQLPVLPALSGRLLHRRGGFQIGGHSKGGLRR